MGKVKATELKRARADYVSLVRHGANGKEFEIFKSADYDRDRKEELSSEEIGFFKKFFRFAKKEEVLNMADIEKLLAGIESLTGTVKGLGDKIEGIENKMSEEKKNEEKETETSKGSEDNTGGEQKGDDQKTKTDGDEGGKNNEVLTKINESIENLTNTVSSLAGRVDKMEQIRRDSNVSQNGIGSGNVTPEKSIYDNLFVNTKVMEVQ